MTAKHILAFSFLFFTLNSYAGEEKIPWGDSGYANEFKYLREKTPEIQKVWDEHEGGEQETALTEVRDAADERLEQVQERYKVMAAKWDLAALKANWDTITPADPKAFRIWLGEEQADWFRGKVSAIRDAVDKAQTKGLEDADALALQPYVQQDVINALKQNKISKNISHKNGDTGAQIKNTQSAAGLDGLAAKKPGGEDQRDLAKFYDGSASAGGPDALAGASPAAAIGGTKMPAPGERGTAASTIKHSAPAGLEGGEGSSVPAKAVKKGAGRALTDAEITTARSMYGDKIDYSKVRIISGKDMTLWGKILTTSGAGVTWGNTIYFPNDENKQSLYDPETQSDWYVHEMAHVYQYQKNGWGYAPKSVWEQLTKGKAAYQYQIEPGKEFGKYGIEQQARIIQDYYSGAIAPSQQGAVETMLRKEGLLGGNEPESTGSSSGAGS